MVSVPVVHNLSSLHKRNNNDDDDNVDKNYCGSARSLQDKVLKIIRVVIQEQTLIK